VLEDDSQVRGEELLVATGRAPVTAQLRLESAGVDLTDRGFISVDNHLHTTADHVWAAGDVAGTPQFTHASWNDFRIIKANFDQGDAVTTGRIVPYTVFITPELARVGMRAKTLHDTTGTWKAVVDADTDLILGAALLGHNAGEVISTLQIAMLGGLSYQQVRDAVLTHPTMGEGLNLLFDALDGQQQAHGETSPAQISSG
jgi:pyruvate/2-oxoglutarate dehydrogenase complex dihydrolipoamide dehydrogenase (E3) component